MCEETQPPEPELPEGMDGLEGLAAREQARPKKKPEMIVVCELRKGERVIGKRIFRGVQAASAWRGITGG